MKRISVLIVEDHAAVREGIKSILKGSGDFLVIAEASSPVQALKALEAHRPELCLVDIALGDTSGLDLLVQMRCALPDCRYVMHSMFARFDYLQASLKNGAVGYITKQSQPEILIAGLKLIAAGEYFFDRHVAELMIPEVGKGSAPLIEACSDDYDQLTLREQQVFRLIAEGQNSRSIAAGLFISHRTVENYKSSLLKKLKIENDAELVRYAQQIGVI